MDAIRTEQLTKKYDLGWRKGRLLALDKLNLRVHEGEVYGLLGPNGSGKSTTLKLILDLISPTEGSAWLLTSPATRSCRGCMSAFSGEPVLLSVPDGCRDPGVLREAVRHEWLVAEEPHRGTAGAGGPDSGA